MKRHEMIGGLAVTRKILLLSAIISMFGTMAVAAPLCVPNATLQSYITGNEPPATQIQVLPLSFDGITNVGISFNSGGWIADPGFPVDAFISFNVATISGAAVIED